MWPGKYRRLVEDMAPCVIRFEVERFIRVSIYLRVETTSPRPADEAEVGAMGRPSFIQVKEGRGEPEAVQVRRREEEE